jgi:hypothetical protein
MRVRRGERPIADEDVEGVGRPVKLEHVVGHVIDGRVAANGREPTMMGPP